MTKTSIQIYIAGPMSGIPNYNYPAFDKKAAELRAQGHIVINPAEIGRAAFGNKLDLSMGDAYALMELELKALKNCDAIYMLRGWENSGGATNEYQHAGMWDKIIMEEEAI